MCVHAFGLTFSKLQSSRDKLLLLQQQKKQRLEENKMTKKKLQSSGTVPQDECTSSSFGFDERAISWATSCIKQLLQLTSPITLPNTSSTTVNQLNNDTMNGYLDDGHIPELDALLSASGEHDGTKMEECMQSALLQGFQNRRILQHMGISIQER
jgi:hypothetical protein